MHSKARFVFLLLSFALISSVSLKASALSQKEIVDLVNQDRERLGLASLSVDPALNLAALAKAQDMIAKNYFAHTSPAGTTPWQWVRSVGYNYSYAGENLAEGYTSAQELEKSWMASASHRANILSPHYSDLGLAVISYNNTNVVVQLFGSKEKLTFVK
jgi:uncharacterized protein YkwD